MYRVPSYNGIAAKPKRIYKRKNNFQFFLLLYTYNNTTHYHTVALYYIWPMREKNKCNVPKKRVAECVRNVVPFSNKTVASLAFVCIHRVDLPALRFIKVPQRYCSGTQCCVR